MAAQLVYEVIVDEPFGSPETMEKLKTDIIFSLNTARRSNVVKIWFLTKNDAEKALVFIQSLKQRKFPRAIVMQNYNYVLVLFGGTGYLEPPIDAGYTIVEVSKSKKPKKPKYSYVSVLDEFLKGTDDVKAIPCERKVSPGSSNEWTQPSSQQFRRVIAKRGCPVEVFVKGDKLYLIKTGGNTDDKKG